MWCLMENFKLVVIFKIEGVTKYYQSISLRDVDIDLECLDDTFMVTLFSVVMLLQLHMCAWIAFFEMIDGVVSESQ